MPESKHSSRWLTYEQTAVLSMFAALALFVMGHVLLFLASMTLFVYAKEGDAESFDSAQTDMWLGYALVLGLTPPLLLLGSVTGLLQRSAHLVRMLNPLLLGMWIAYVAWRLSG